MSQILEFTNGTATAKFGVGQTRYVLGAIGAKNRRAYAYFAGAPIAPIAFQY